MNTPVYKKSFGNIKNIDDLLSIISLVEFQKYYHMTKQKINIFKDCPFKLMCVDGRLNNKSWFHKEECNYTSYTGKWKEKTSAVKSKV